MTALSRSCWHHRTLMQIWWRHSGRPFWWCYLPPNWSTTMHINRGDRWLLIEPLTKRIVIAVDRLLWWLFHGQLLEITRRASLLTPRSLFSPLSSLSQLLILRKNFTFCGSFEIHNIIPISSTVNIVRATLSNVYFLLLVLLNLLVF